MRATSTLDDDLVALAARLTGTAERTALVTLRMGAVDPGWPARAPRAARRCGVAAE